MTTVLTDKQSASRLFSILADLYQFPDAELWEDITYHHILKDLSDYSSQWLESDRPVELTDLPGELKEMQEIYQETLGGAALPVESIYKEWTADRTCFLPIARSKGYLLGDSALHVRFILEKFELEIPEEFHSIPDHLAVLLELLGFFVLYADEKFTKQFLADHFDWLDDFSEKLEALPGNQFYLQVTRFLQQILNSPRLFREL